MAVHPARWIYCFLLVIAMCLTCHSAGGDTSLRHRGDATLVLQVSDGFSTATREAVGLWTDFIADALWRVYGRWPRTHWTISVEPASGSVDDPIPWGQVQRGQVDRVEFFILPNASAEALKQAWTGYHELAHLLIPYRGWGDAWFSEGLATYYQNLMQARGGVINERQMWQKLYEGFERGMGDSRFDGQPLAVVSARMRENGGFMRVYWSGAWYFLHADLHLRQQSDGQQDLDSALAALNRCCERASLSVPAIVAQLDELNDTGIFTATYHTMLDIRRQPQYQPLFEQLDIAVVDGQVVLGQDSAGARLRRQLTAP